MDSSAPYALASEDAAAELGHPLASVGAGRRAVSKRPDHRRQFSLLLVRGDGVRVLRFSFPRRLPLIMLGVAAVGASALGTLAGDWWKIRQKMLEVRPLLSQIDAQQATIDSFNRRAADLRREVAGWRDLHARIWEPFGPEAPRGREAGVGGAKATLPESAAGSASPGDELTQLTETVKQEGESLRALDGLIGRARKALTSLPSRWPVRGGVNSEFGRRADPWTGAPEFHSGMDIAAQRGTPVHAPAAGTVAFAGSLPEFGLTVKVEHSQDLKTIYGHLSKLAVSQGQKVERGSLLGYSGNTGRSSGPHLHYEIHVKGHPVNPRAYLWN
jgi:murein DD-endopeptidase MepM/ murein hydrolase activator NlpD